MIADCGLRIADFQAEYFQSEITNPNSEILRKGRSARGALFLWEREFPYSLI
jgi:hypothetical protein